MRSSTYSSTASTSTATPRADNSRRRFGAEPTAVSSRAGTIRLRLDQTAADVLTGFNREEHLQPIPADNPDHQVLYWRRNDTESGNRLLDDSMLRERAHTVGHRRQLLNMITWAAVRNASAARQHAPKPTSRWSISRTQPRYHQPRRTSGSCLPRTPPLPPE